VVVDGDYPGQFKVAVTPGSAWTGWVPYVWESRAAAQAWIKNDSQEFLARRKAGDEIDDEISN
jgi:heme-degrading monooxygenase HmoA